MNLDVTFIPERGEIFCRHSDPNGVWKPFTLQFTRGEVNVQAFLSTTDAIHLAREIRIACGVEERPPETEAV